MLTGGSTGSSCSSADRPAVVSDQVIRKHPAQRDASTRLKRTPLFKELAGKFKSQFNQATYFLKSYEPLTNGRTTLSQAQFSKLQKRQVLRDEALSILLSCFVDN